MNYVSYHFTQAPLFGPTEEIARVNSPDAADAIERLMQGYEHFVTRWMDIWSVL